MKPANQHQARYQVQLLMKSKIRKRSPTAKKRIINKCQMIIETIWRHWQVGIYQLRSKHITWFMDVFLANKSSATRYDYWRWIADILTAINRYKTWEPQLRKSWRNPKGKPFKYNYAGRNPKLKDSTGML